jgi:Tfp pilus assembly protein PilF
MALSGTLRTLSLAEIFQTLARTDATGVLSLDAVERGADVIFDHGVVTQIIDRSVQGDRDLLQRMEACGVIADIEFAEIEETGSGGYVTLGRLIDSGRLQDARTRDIIQQLMQDQLYDLFTWEEANFTFVESGQADNVDEMIARSQKLGVGLQADSLLMESARRLDEWGRIRSALPSNDIILTETAGSRELLDDLSQDYPANSVIPLIDGIRSVEELVAESVATRLDVYAVLVDLLDHQLLAPLDNVQIRNNAAYYDSVGDFGRSSRLYRRALAINPSDSSLVRALAISLERFGDAPEAAGCYRQLALGHLADGAHTEALASARRAIELSHGKAVTECKVLIQCLDESGDFARARRERLDLAYQQLEDGHWHSAQDLCLEVLDSNPGDIDARHLLAQAVRHNDAWEFGQDEVLCIECGQVNKRGLSHCSACKALLEIECSQCTRPVMVSDEVCIFCGHDPHRQATDSSESNIFAAVGGSEDSTFRNNVQQAVEAKNRHDYTTALDIWREIARSRPESRHIRQHLREMEMLAHHHTVEQLIVRGNKANQSRRYYIAVRCYKGALQSLSEDDARRPRLQGMLATAVANHRRASIVYSFALLVLLAALLLILLRQYRIREFREYADTQIERAEMLLSQDGGANAYLEIVDIKKELTKRASEVGGDTSEAWHPIEMLVSQARQSFAEADLVRIQRHLAARQAEAARNTLQRFKTVFGSDIHAVQLVELEQRLKRLEAEIADEQALADQAPAQLRQATQAEQEGRLQAALQLAENLRTSSNTIVARDAAAMADRLTERLQQFRASLEQLQQTGQRDYRTALDSAAALQETAKSWQAGPRLNAIVLVIRANQQQADRNWTVLQQDPDMAAIERFLASFPGSRHLPAVQALRQELRRQGQRRRDLELAYQAAREQEDWASMHARGQELHRDFPDTRKQLVLPLVIESAVPGGRVLRGGQSIGSVPTVMFIQPDSAERLRIEYPGCEPVEARIQELSDDWRWEVRPQRAIVWTYRNNQPADGLQSLGPGRLLLWQRDGLGCLNNDGQLLWRKRIQDLGLGDTPRWHRSVAIAEDDHLIVYDDGAGIIHQLNFAGRETFQVDLNGTLYDRPLLYRNELFGPELRYAMAASSLQLVVDGQLRTVDVGEPLIAGPCLYRDDTNQILLMASISGHLLGWNEVDRVRAWRLDLGAAQVDHLRQWKHGRYIAVLDDSRLALVGADQQGLQLRWEQPLPASLVEPPMHDAGQVLLATTDGIHQVHDNGQLAQIIPSAVPVSCAGVRGPFTILADNDRRLLAYRDTRLVWQRHLPQAAQAIGFIDDLLVVALQDGAIMALRLE